MTSNVGSEPTPTGPCSDSGSRAEGRSSGAYHLPSLACHHPGPFQTSLTATPPRPSLKLYRHKGKTGLSTLTARAGTPSLPARMRDSRREIFGPAALVSNDHEVMRPGAPDHRVGGTHSCRPKVGCSYSSTPSVTYPRPSHVGQGPKALPMPLPIPVVLIIPGSCLRPRHSGQRRPWSDEGSGCGSERPSGARSGTSSRVSASDPEQRL